MKIQNKKKLELSIVFVVLTLTVLVLSGCVRLEKLEGTWTEQTDAHTVQEMFVEKQQDGTFDFAVMTYQHTEDGSVVPVGTGILGSCELEDTHLNFKIEQVFNAPQWTGSIETQREKGKNNENGEVLTRWFDLSNNTITLYSNEEKTETEGARLTGTFEKN